MSNLLLDILNVVQPAVLISNKIKDEPHIFVCRAVYSTYMCHGDLHEDSTHGLFLFVQKSDYNEVQLKNIKVLKSEGYAYAKVKSVEEAKSAYIQYVRGYFSEGRMDPTRKVDDDMPEYNKRQGS